VSEGGHRWRPIEDLPEGWEGLGDRDLPALAAEWAEGAERYADATEIREFRRQLIREIAIETGVIEGLYSIDRGVTETLIRVGLIKEELEQGVLDRTADEILPLLHDHESATEGLFDFVKQNRPLSVSYIRELHAHLTRHQTETDAVTPDGRRVRVPLLRGEWKRQPNNPRREDGTVHEYCPPEQVGSEMDELLRMHATHEEWGVPPDVEAAWLHHRFTQIHPFQDGNGRVARSLASLALLRAKWSLLNVTRNDSGYIGALEAADDGDLSVFVRLVADQQRNWFNKAVSVISRVEARMGRAAEQVGRRAAEREGVRGRGEQALRLLRSAQKAIHNELNAIIAETEWPEGVDPIARIPGDEKRRVKDALTPAFWAAIGAGDDWELAPVKDAVFVDLGDVARSQFGFQFSEARARSVGEVPVVPYVQSANLIGGDAISASGRMTRRLRYADDAFKIAGDMRRDDLLRRLGFWLADTIPFLLLEWERRR
jgi:hypothetical protein